MFWRPVRFYSTQRFTQHCNTVQKFSLFVFWRSFRCVFCFVQSHNTLQLQHRAEAPIFCDLEVSHFVWQCRHFMATKYNIMQEIFFCVCSGVRCCHYCPCPSTALHIATIWCKSSHLLNSGGLLVFSAQDRQPHAQQFEAP